MVIFKSPDDFYITFKNFNNSTSEYLTPHSANHFQSFTDLNRYVCVGMGNSRTMEINCTKK